MKSSSSLPEHLYLVRTPASQHLHKPSPDTMGAKGYNLHRMTEAGLNVPVALVIGTHYTHATQDCFLPVFSVGLHALEESTGLLVGDDRNPLTCRCARAPRCRCRACSKPCSTSG